MATASADIRRHTYFEDAQAILGGTLLIALGVNFFTQVGLLSGGTAGLAFLAQYATPLTFGQAFFLINLPFYWLAIRRIGWAFTIKTFIAVFCVSFFSDITPLFISLSDIHPLYAGGAGGLLMGVGFLMLFRHNASLGGLNILARYLSETRGISIGKFQMAVDSIVLFLSLFIVDPWLIAISILGAVALNFILTVNHKPGRYLVQP